VSKKHGKLALWSILCYWTLTGLEESESKH
jgi:hypothetical protein